MSSKPSSESALSAIILKRPPFAIFSQPTYYIDDDNEYILFLTENVIYKYIVSKDKYTEIRYSRKQIARNNLKKPSGRLQIARNPFNESLFIYDYYGTIKQFNLNRNQWFDHSIDRYFAIHQNQEISHYAHSLFPLYHIGCYLPEPFNLIYFMSKQGQHYIYYPKLRKLQLLKVKGVGFGGDRLIYCRALKRLLLFKFNCSLIYYLDLNGVKQEIKTELEWKFYDNGCVVCILLYQYILIMIKKNKITCLDLKYDKLYKCSKTLSNIPSFTVRNDIAEKFEYGVVSNDGSAHLFSR